MSGPAPELQARQIVQRMHRLRQQVDSLATHARMLRLSRSVDARALMQEADALLQTLLASRVDFRNADAHIASLSRSLPSRPPRGMGVSPAAQWGAELRAASRQFREAVGKAENELGQLYTTAETQMNSPTRTQTSIENVWDVAGAFIELLTKWVENRRRQPH